MTLPGSDSRRGLVVMAIVHRKRGAEYPLEVRRPFSQHPTPEHLNTCPSGYFRFSGRRLRTAAPARHISELWISSSSSCRRSR